MEFNGNALIKFCEKINLVDYSKFFNLKFKIKLMIKTISKNKIIFDFLVINKKYIFYLKKKNFRENNTNFYFLIKNLF